jgi:hypothetical protein
VDGAQIKKYESHRVSTNLNVAVLGTRKGLGCACSEILDLGSVDFQQCIEAISVVAQNSNLQKLTLVLSTIQAQHLPFKRCEHIASNCCSTRSPIMPGFCRTSGVRQQYCESNKASEPKEYGQELGSQYSELVCNCWVSCRCDREIGDSKKCPNRGKY